MSILSVMTPFGAGFERCGMRAGSLRDVRGKPAGMARDRDPPLIKKKRYPKEKTNSPHYELRFWLESQGFLLLPSQKICRRPARRRPIKRQNNEVFSQ